MTGNVRPTSPSSSSGASSAAGTTTPCATCICTIVSQTVATIPANRTRANIGVGEEVTLTFSLGSANWTNTGGSLSSTSGSSVTFTASDRAASITVTATNGGCTASRIFTILEPSGVTMERAPGTGVWHTHNIPSVGIKTVIYISPSTVSFENISISEDDCAGAVTGYFVGTPLDGVRHAGHGAGSWVTVGSVTAGKGSKVDGQDTARSGHCNFGTPYASGTFDWPIPWLFKVDSGASKKFTIVHQRFTIDAAGAMTVSKARASANKNLADASSTY